MYQTFWCTRKIFGVWYEKRSHAFICIKRFGIGHSSWRRIFGVPTSVTRLYVSNVLGDTAHEGGFLVCRCQSRVYMCQTFWHLTPHEGGFLVFGVPRSSDAPSPTSNATTTTRHYYRSLSLSSTTKQNSNNSKRSEWEKQRVGANLPHVVR